PSVFCSVFIYSREYYTMLWKLNKEIKMSLFFMALCAERSDGMEVIMNNEKFRDELREQLKVDVQNSDFNNPESLKTYKKYLSDSIIRYKELYTQANLYEVKEYINYLVSALLLKCKQYYPNVSIYIPFRTKSDLSFNRNLDKETTKQFIENDDCLLNDEKIIGDINAITLVLDHINFTIPMNPNYNYKDNIEIDNLLEESNKLCVYVEETENDIDGLLTKEEYLNYKKEILTKIMQISFAEFTEERTPSYMAELLEVEKALGNLSTSASYATESETMSLKKLLNELKEKLFDKAYYNMMPEIFETVIADPLFVKGFHITSEFIKDVKKENGFAANYYSLKTPIGLIEVQLQSAKRYYEAKKGSAAHNSIPGKQLNIKELFELVDPNDPKPLDYYLNYLDKTPSTKIDYDFSYLDKHSNEYKEAEKIKEFLKHIKLKDFYDGDILQNNEQQNTPIDKFIYLHAIKSSPYLGICRSAHTNFRNVDIIHRSRVSAYADVLRKIDTLSCLGDIVVSRLQNYISNSKDNSIKNDTDEVQEIGIQAINKYISYLNKKLDKPENDIVK
ncbi:MAG: hypothetical protein IJH76_01410, partial [Clostridia bacterium]|nr:hypothetical protein [Clostridia bacterium]